MLFDVLVIGDLFRDVIMSGFAAFPRLGTESFARELRYEIGGGTAITASGLAKLGMRVAAMGIVGEDEARWMIDRLNRVGVDTSLIQVDPVNPTGTTISVSFSGDRAFFTYNGANEGLPGLLTSVCARQAHHVHFAFPFDAMVLADVIRQLQTRGTTVSVDVGWQERWLMHPDSLEVLRLADLFFPNEHEGQLITGHSDPTQMLDELQSRGIRNIALKLGQQGALLRLGEQQYRAIPLSVDVVDTTGAGDSFDAGFLSSWIRKLPPQRCLSVANICGALSTRSLGGIAGFPSSAEVETMER